jgi:hypothetical protein
MPGIEKPGTCPFILRALSIPGLGKPRACPFILVAYLVPYKVFLL